MKILCVVNSYGSLHGSAQSAKDLARSLAALPARFRVTMLTTGCKNICEEYFIENVIPANPFSDSPLLLGKNRKLRQLVRFFERIILSIKIFLGSYDVVIVNGWNSKAIWELIRPCCARSLKIIISRESPRHFQYSDKVITLQDQIYFFRQFEYYIFVSSILLQEWSQLASLASERCYYLPNTVDDSRFFVDHSSRETIRLKSRIDLALKSDQYLVLIVGGFEARKGHLDLLQAALILSSRGINIKFICLGNNRTTDAGAFMDKVEQHSLENIFLFPGASYYPDSWYKASDLFVFPSKAEAMPRSILESMISLVPVLATNVDGIPELIIDKETGLLIDPGDYVSLASKIEYIYNNRDVSIEYALASQDRYYELFSPSSHKNNLLQILIRIEALIGASR